MPITVSCTQILYYAYQALAPAKMKLNMEQAEVSNINRGGSNRTVKAADSVLVQVALPPGLQAPPSIFSLQLAVASGASVTVTSPSNTKLAIVKHYPCNELYDPRLGEGGLKITERGSIDHEVPGGNHQSPFPVALSDTGTKQSFEDKELSGYLFWGDIHIV
ncbi:hypothetical protein ARMSODRAFT_981335 [Armillaria solidipes]|uniref:Uncharacterized protein n=1 Tax=Armillaria solidipes TaxID=1076256 RepID=A0A2H3AS13_9AGAR|nr:hypothetical protein ARMSODRAFT_981335 [Armillaria solidipes]